MFTSISNFTMYAFMGASLWLLVSLFRLIPRDSRETAKRHLMLCLVVIVGSIAANIYALSNQYKDYGLSSPEGLEDAIAARKVQDEADRVARDAAAAQRKVEQEARELAERTEQRCKDTMMAFVMSQNFVKRELRAPATAQFPNSGEARVAKTGDCTFRVQSHVDAQNGFGALIRSRYQVDMEYLPASNTWRGTNVIIDG